MNMPLVSVIIPMYNAQAWIYQTLDSLRGQTYRNLEIIVVDDESSDDGAAIVEAFPDTRVRLIRQKNQGACVARNRGIEESSGELLQFLDADDMLGRDKLAVQIERWRELGDNYVYFGPYAHFSSEPGDIPFRPAGNWRDMSGLDWLIDSWSGDDMMAPHAWLTPRRLVDKAGPWHEKLKQNQDGEYFSRVLLASRGVRFCPGAESFYRIGMTGSISASRSRAAIESRLRSAEMICERILRRENSPRARAACANFFEEVKFVSYPLYPELSAKADYWVEMLGGSSGRQIYRGKVFKMTAPLVGWKLARTLQWMLRDRRGYQTVRADAKPDERERKKKGNMIL